MGRSDCCSSGGDSSRQSLSGSQRVCGQVTHLWTCPAHSVSDAGRRGQHRLARGPGLK